MLHLDSEFVGNKQMALCSLGGTVLILWSFNSSVPLGAFGLTSSPFACFENYGDQVVFSCSGSCALSAWST